MWFLLAFSYALHEKIHKIHDCVLDDLPGILPPTSLEIMELMEWYQVCGGIGQKQNQMSPGLFVSPANR
jgi:hypothetical protein